MNDARRFLNTLAPDSNLTFQTFPDCKGGAEAPPKILHGSLEQHYKTLKSLNNSKSGIYLMVNRGDGKGRKAENVIRVRAVFADFDGVELPTSWQKEPSIIVESSKGRYHAYWAFSDHLPLDQFRGLQKSIAKCFGSDDKVCDLPRVMRLPGFYHHKKQPFLSRLIKCDSLRYESAELYEAYPIEALEVKVHRPAFRPSFDTLSDGIKRYGQKALENQYDLVVSTTEGQRNHALNKAAFSLGRLVGSGILSHSEVEDTLMNAGLASGLDEREIRITCSSGIRAGIKNPYYLEEKSDTSYSEVKAKTAQTKDKFIPYREKRRLRRKHRLNALMGFGGQKWTPS